MREWEADEKISTSVTRRRARLFPASKVAGDLSRRDPLRDAEIFQAIVRSVGVGNAVCFGRGRETAVNKAILSFPELSEEGKDGNGRTKHTIWTPDWSHTGDRLKMLSAALATLGGTDVWAFTINLTPEAVERALRSPRGVVGYLSDRLVRNLKIVGLETGSWAFLIEATPLHMPHLHGVIRASSPTDLRMALIRAGGHRGGLSGREVDVSPISDLAGWVNYITKNPLLTRKTLQRASSDVSATFSGGIMGAAQRVRAGAKRWYESKRGSGEPIN